MNPLHYPPLELTKKLKKIGMITNSGYGYGECQLLGNNHEPEFSSKQYFHDTNKSLDWIFIECPSVMEMLDVIPIRICVNNKGYFLDFIPGSIKYVMRYRDNGEYNGENVIFRIEDTLPNALAKMILWLVENNYISFTK